VGHELLTLRASILSSKLIIITHIANICKTVTSLSIRQKEGLQNVCVVSMVVVVVIIADGQQQ
jgi:hypothetical protein